MNILANELQSDNYQRFIGSRDHESINKRSSESKEPCNYKADNDRNTKLIPSIKIPIMSVGFTEKDKYLLEKFIHDKNLINAETDDLSKTSEQINKEIYRVSQKYSLILHSGSERKIACKLIIPIQMDEMDRLKDISIELGKAEAVISEKIYLNKPFSYSLTACFAEKFEKLRADLGIDRKVFIDSLKYCSKLIMSGGKTESDFFKTDDKRFIAKFIATTEFEMSIQIAPSYFKYFNNLKAASKKTLLCPILGIYEMKVGSEQTKYLIIMNNVFYGLEDRIENLKVYDLKGSRKNRLRKENLKGKTLMDTNFDLERNGDLLAINSHPEFDFFQVVERDCTFLRQQEIVDYSLLLVIDESQKIVTCGIIDYLRKYDLIKKLEHRIKKLQYLGEDPTIVKPEAYANRFISSLKKRIVIIEDLSKASE